MLGECTHDSGIHQAIHALRLQSGVALDRLSLGLEGMQQGPLIIAGAFGTEGMFEQGQGFLFMGMGQVDTGLQ